MNPHDITLALLAIVLGAYLFLPVLLTALVIWLALLSLYPVITGRDFEFFIQFHVVVFSCLLLLMVAQMVRYYFGAEDPRTKTFIEAQEMTEEDED